MKKPISLFLRYILLVIIAFPNLNLIYSIFTPLTIYPVYFFLSLFFQTSLSGVIIILEGTQINLAKACIAGSAYYLLLVLNLSTSMRSKKRIFSLLFLLTSFLLINILRILFFSILLIRNFSLFNTFHLITWYFLSAGIVFGVWLVNIKIFKIKKIPIYSDFKSFLKSIKKIKNT